MPKIIGGWGIRRRKTGTAVSFEPGRIKARCGKCWQLNKLIVKKILKNQGQAAITIKREKEEPKRSECSAIKF